MVDKAPKVTIDQHYPTGGAEFTVSFWIYDYERQGLIERIIAEETSLHDRKQVVEGLQLTNFDTQTGHETAESEGSETEQSREVTIK